MSARSSFGLLSLLLVCLAPAVVPAVESLEELHVGGKYRMQLTTGDIFEGTIEFKDDTSLIIETLRGPFSFRGALILEYEMVEPPPSRPADDTQDSSPSGVLSFSELLARGPSDRLMEIRIHSGSLFKGTVAEIDSEGLRLNVEGSMIPIGQNVIAAISPVVDTPAAQPTETVPQGPFDTVFVVNPKTDDEGNPLAPLALVGKIRRYDDRGLTVTTPRGITRTIDREKIARIIRHTANDFEAEIKRYAKPLFCPEGMNLIDLPPGKEGRPFFKVCIDKYEYPNTEGAMPKGNVSYHQAAELCAAAGKRLCSATEWQWACGGLEGYTYPYGWHFEKDKCNARGVNEIETAGNRHHCRGKFGVYDMVGNIFEWVTTAEGSPALMGGPYSKCQTVSPGVDGSAKPQTGFRCCTGN